MPQVPTRHSIGSMAAPLLFAEESTISALETALNKIRAGRFKAAQLHPLNATYFRWADNGSESRVREVCITVNYVWRRKPVCSHLYNLSGCAYKDDALQYVEGLRVLESALLDAASRAPNSMHMNWCDCTRISLLC